MRKMYDVIVIGGGHAGIEAALSSSRMKCKTLLITMDIHKIGYMSCNPAIGGIGKGQLVKEIDALGGEMAKATDATGIQFRVLNKSKGPAVWSSRAQVDRRLYNRYMKEKLEAQPNLDVLEDVVDALLIKRNKIQGVLTKSGLKINSTCVVITSGTFLDGIIHIGKDRVVGGRINEQSSKKLSHSLRDSGLRIMRFKTCTPPRIDGKSVDFSRMKIQKGDKMPQAFSFSSNGLRLRQLPCYLVYTNEVTHKIIAKNLSSAPIVTGDMEGADVRYCPSIEAKIARFPERTRHQIFIEPEGLDTDEKYCNGLFTSFPLDIQNKMLRSIQGLEKVNITKPGYGIEYDAIDSQELKLTLETKNIKGLFFAGQVNGTTGYEEAAAQGLMAGINAALKVKEKDPFILDRSQAYIGVLIDDLVTKGTKEPYRMFTSRVEYRLILRQDNADLRLTERGYRLELVDKKTYNKAVFKKERIAQGLERISNVKLYPNTKTNDTLKKWNISINNVMTLLDLLKRPGVSFDVLKALDKKEENVLLDPPKSAARSAQKLLYKDLQSLLDEETRQIEIEVKYKGFIDRQAREVNNFKRIENIKVPESFKFDNISGLSNEIVEKLSIARPANLGQASRISGITPVAISILMIYLKKRFALCKNK